MGKPREILNARSYRPEITRTITVKGPLGELKLDVPGFVRLEENKEDKTVSLGVEDANVKHQKEMWGTFFFCYCLFCFTFGCRKPSAPTFPPCVCSRKEKKKEKGEK